MRHSTSLGHVDGAGRVGGRRVGLLVAVALVMNVFVVAGGMALVGSAGAVGWTAPTVDTVEQRFQRSPSRRLVSGLVRTSGPDLMVVYLARGSGRVGARFSDVRGCGLPWRPVVRANGQVAPVEIWAAEAPSKLRGCRVTAWRQYGSGKGLITVVGYRGASGIGATAAASARKGPPSVSLSTTRPMSLVAAVGSDPDRAVARTPVDGQRMLSQFLARSGTTYYVQTRKAPVDAPSTVRIKQTSPKGHRSNIAMVEILADLPATDPPATEPPATDPPATDPPATEPPATEPPATDPPATEPPATDPPATDPPATEPPATPLGCASNPSACGFPDASNSGVASGSELKSVPGEVSSGPGWRYDSRGWISIFGDGAVFSGYSATVNVDVTASNVTIENNRLVVKGDSFGVSLRHTSNVVIKNNSISAPDAGANRLMVGVKDIYGDATGTQVLGNDISRTSTGVQIYSGRIQDNYIHHMGYQSGDHINGTTSNGSAVPLTIRHNTIFNSFNQTDAISLFEDFGVEANRVIDNNLVAGGGYTIYGGQNPGGPISHDVKITNNRFSRIYFPNGGYYGPVTAFNPAAPGNQWSGNVWDDTGKPVNP